jgi:hypothetical protein
MKKTMILAMLACAAQALHGAAFSTLNFSSSVRGDSMGGAYSAVSSGIDGLSGNPASLKDLASQELYTTFISREGMSYAGVSYGMPLGKKGGALGVMFGYFDAGSLEVNYYDGSTATFSAQRDLLFGAAYGFQLGRDLSAGIALKALSSTLADNYRTTVFAGDAGVKLALLDWPVLAASIVNAGMPAKYLDTSEDLPMAARIGACYTLKSFKPDLLNAAVEAELGFYDKLKVSIGAEYVYQGFLSVRAGYRINQDAGNITAGLGFSQKFEGFGTVVLDYAFMYSGGWMDTHKAGLTVKF